MKKIFKKFANKIKQAIPICLMLFFNVLVNTTVYGQNSLKQPSPSSNFSNTFSSGVDLYTGKINVEFDLAALKFAGQDLSLRIKYLAGNGVKVDDLPSWVGLGWGLDAPGYVYRKVKGKPDELQTYKSVLTMGALSMGNPLSPFSLKSTLSKSLATELHAQNKSFVNNRTLLGGSNWNAPSTILSYKPSGQNGLPYTSHSLWAELGAGTYFQTSITNVNITPVIDLVPDEFSVQIGELNGSFFLNSAGEWTFISSNQLSCKVEVIIDYNYLTEGRRTPGVITKIVLTSSKGIRYTFDGDFESSNVSTAFDFNSPGFSIPGGNYFYDLTPTLWNISKIENLNTQEQIIYSYKPSYYQFSKYHSAYGHSGIIIYDNQTTIGNDFSDWNYYTANYKVARRTKLLEAITCSNGYKIEFNSSLSNQLLSDQSFYGYNDFSTDPILAGKTFKYNLYKLNSISVFNGSNLVNKIVLKYNEKPTERLQLERIEFTNETVVSNFVSFNYNNVKLPDYGSRKTDHWGYYNGKDFFGIYPSGSYSNSLLESYSGTFKSADTSLTDAEILEGFTLATGAKTTFEYEPNQYYAQVDDVSRQPVAVVGSTYGGGVRIKKVKIEQDNQQFSSTNYYYVKENQSSSGILAQTPPSYITAVGANYSFKQAGFSTNITNSNTVTYSRVVQKQQDTITTITDFTNFDNGFADLPSQVKNFSGTVSDIKDAYNDFGFKRGKIKSVKKMLLGQTLPLEEVVYKYQHDFSDAAYPEYRAIHMSNASPDFYYSVITYKRYPDLLLDIKTISNDNLGTIESSKTFAYDNFNNLTEETIITSNGILKTAYKYPYHFTSSVYQDMVAKNLLTPIVETIVSKDNVQISLRRNNFDRFNVNNILLPKSIEMQFGSHPAITKHLFNKYNEIGGLLEDQIPNGPKSSYLWGYQNQYVVANVSGSDYDSVTPLVGQSILNNPSSDSQLISTISTLRTSLPDALITSHTYKPLVGMTSQTDPKGMTTYYDYDSFGRLENIKDHNGNIVKNYAYNYTNAETTVPVTYYQSQERSEPYIKNNCPSGQNGTSVTYTVEAGKYSSTISPSDADAKALNDIYANGQKNANLLGGCSVTAPPPVFHNVSKTDYRTKNNCASGETSSPVPYIVPANTYSAATQIAADQLALDDIAANAQEHANKTGTCTTVAPPTTYYNTLLTVPSIKSNCATGLNGSPVNYSVPAGRYSSTVSQVEADRQAMADVTANGQEYANNYGGCSTAPAGSFNFVVSTSVPSMFKVIFNFASNGGSNEYMIGGQNITILAPGSGTGSVTLIDLDPQPSTYTFNVNGAVMNGPGATFNNVSFSGSVNLTAQRTSDYYYYSQQRSGQAKKTCPSGQTGNWVTYTVPAGKYSSLISLADANQKAQNDVNANVQSYANSNGGCALNLSINYNTPASTQSTIVIYNSTAGGQQSYPVSGSGTLTDISPGTVTITVIPTAVEGVTHSYSLGAHTPAVNSQYAAFGPLKLTSGMTLSITSNQIFKNAALTVSRVKNNCAVGQGGSAVNYTVPANKYSSTDSQADADAQAQADVIVNAQTYANENGTCSGVFWNTAISASATRNNCPAGQSSTPITYTVAAGTYSSSTQEAADQQAQNDLAANAQTYANTNGVCSIIYNSSIATRTLARNNCPAGQNGGTATYTSSAGKHKSLISQADADALAQADLDANAQTWANNYGTCTSPTVYKNNYMQVSKTKNNCPAGQISYPVIYYVQQNAYSSTISQADANAKAQADLDANGQNYANANGTCVLAPATIAYSLPDKQYTVTITNISNSVASVHTISGSGTIPNIVSASYTVYIEPVEFDGVSHVFTLGNSAPITSEYASFGPIVLTGNVILNVSLPAAVYYNVAMSVAKTRNNCAVGEIGTTVTYSVAASTYSSTVSQAAANALAQANLDANAQNYANTNGTCSPPVTYYSIAKSVVKTRNNCTVGQNGSSVTYTSTAGKHTSLISQADADAKAQADLDANAQAYANTNGTCTAGTVYWNTQQYLHLKRNNCAVGQTGGNTVLYNVPANTYSSTISQADANAQAQADITANAQNYANANGTCVSSTFSISYNIPTGTQFQIRVINHTTGATTYHTTSGTSGTFSGLPIGVGYVSVYELNTQVGYYYTFAGFKTGIGGASTQVQASEAHFEYRGLQGNMALDISEYEQY